MLYYLQSHKTELSMSASAIPNLNTLRRGQRGRGRGRGNAASGADAAGPGRPQAQDEIIQQTDHDAATSRLSAVEAGYLEDPFARLLSADESVARRLPLMNRGRLSVEDNEPNFSPCPLQARTSGLHRLTVSWTRFSLPPAMHASRSSHWEQAVIRDSSA